MFRNTILAISLFAFASTAYAGAIDDREPIINNGKGLVVGTPTGGNLGPGTGNFANGIYNNGVPVAGGLTVPNTCVLGGTGTALSSVTLGTNLSCTNGTLNATGGGGSGTVSAVAVTPANGLTGSVATSTTTPTITLGTTISGLVKANGTGFIAATPGTDFLAPAGSGASLTGLTFGQLPALTANQILGAATATTPAGISVPSCSAASSALTWTLGTGFGCNTISGGTPGGSTGQVQVNNSGTFGGLAVGATGNSTIVQTTSGGLLTPSLLPIATTGALGAFKPDGSTITVNSSTGVASAVGGAATSVVVGTTTVGGGTSGQFLYNNAGAIGSAPTTGTGTTAVLNVSPSIATPTITGLATLTGGLSDSSTTGISTGGGLTFSGGPTVQLGGAINNIVTYNFPTTGFIRNRYFLDTVTANTNSSQIDEGYFLQRQYGGTATLTGEINGFHAAFTDVAGITLNNSMENFEASDFYVTAHNGVTSYLALHNFGSTGSSGVVNGFIAGLTNSNTTANSIVTWGAFDCQSMGGGGSLPQHNYCVNNQDPLQLIMTKGHLQFFAQFQPTLSGCGTSPSMDGYSSNSQGVVTEGTGATGCTITWATFDPWSIGLNPHCDVTSPNGSALISYTPTTATMTIVNLTGSPSPAKYKWSCFQ